MLKGIDISNYSGPLTDAQVDWCERNLDFVIIGLQDRGTARGQAIKLSMLHQEYYMTRPHQDLSWLPYAARVWLDIEEGCLESTEDVIKALATLCNRRLFHGWYCNQTSWEKYVPTLGDRVPGPLWWASWGIPPLTGYEPWVNFDGLMVHQVASAPDNFYPAAKELGLNCDINFAVEGMFPSNRE